MGRNDRKCLQCEGKYQVSRKYFGKAKNQYCPPCFIKFQEITIKQLNKRLDKLTDQMDRAMSACTNLNRNEYFNEPALIITALQKQVAAVAYTAREEIIKRENAVKKREVSDKKLLYIGGGVISLLDLVLKQKQDAGLWFTPLGAEEERIQGGLTALHDKIVTELQDLTGGKKRNASN